MESPPLVGLYQKAEVLVRQAGDLARRDGTLVRFEGFN